MWVAIAGTVVFLLIAFVLVFGAIAARFGDLDGDYVDSGVKGGG